MSAWFLAMIQIRADKAVRAPGWASAWSRPDVSGAGQIPGPTSVRLAPVQLYVSCSCSCERDIGNRRNPDCESQNSRSKQKDNMNERTMTGFEGKRGLRGSLRVGWVASQWRVALQAVGSPLARRRVPGNAFSPASLPGIRGQSLRFRFSAFRGPRECAGRRTAGSLRCVAAADRIGRLASFHRARLRP